MPLNVHLHRQMGHQWMVKQINAALYEMEKEGTTMKMGEGNIKRWHIIPQEE